MRHQSRSPNRLIVRHTASVTLLALVACSADTPAPAEPVANQVYDVTTTLDTFSFETPGVPAQPPDCPISTQYCTHRRAFGGATLTGTLTFASGTVSGNFSGLFCSSWTTTDGCTAVKPMAPMNYLYYSGDRAITPGSGPYTIWLAQGTLAPNVYLSAMGSGDSLFGRVAWASSIGRSPPGHTGTFVARLRH